MFEGQEFTFECKSTGATPPSVYSYGKLFTFFIEDNMLCKGLLTISVYIIQVKNIAGQQFKIKKKTSLAKLFWFKVEGNTLTPTEIMMS